MGIKSMLLRNLVRRTKKFREQTILDIKDVVLLSDFKMILDGEINDLPLVSSLLLNLELLVSRETLKRH